MAYKKTLVLLAIADAKLIQSIALQDAKNQLALAFTPRIKLMLSKKIADILSLEDDLLAVTLLSKHSDDDLFDDDLSIALSSYLDDDIDLNKLVRLILLSDDSDDDDLLILLVLLKLDKKAAKKLLKPKKDLKLLKPKKDLKLLKPKPKKDKSDDNDAQVLDVDLGGQIDLDFDNYNDDSDDDQDIDLDIDDIPLYDSDNQSNYDDDDLNIDLDIDDMPLYSADEDIDLDIDDLNLYAPANEDGLLIDINITDDDKPVNINIADDLDINFDDDDDLLLLKGKLLLFALKLIKKLQQLNKHLKAYSNKLVKLNKNYVLAILYLKYKMDLTKLANHKIGLVTKLFEAKAWTQNQKLSILEAFDKALNLKLSTLVYLTYKNTITKPLTLGSASRQISSTKPKTLQKIIKLNKATLKQDQWDIVRQRNLKLAGIKKLLTN